MLVGSTFGLLAIISAALIIAGIADLAMGHRQRIRPAKHRQRRHPTKKNKPSP